MFCYIYQNVFKVMKCHQRNTKLIVLFNREYYLVFQLQSVKKNGWFILNLLLKLPNFK